MRKIIKKGDIALLVIFTAAAVLIACIPFIRNARSTSVSGSGYGNSNSPVTDSVSSGSGDLSAASDETVVITIAGELYGTWPLSEDRTIEIANTYGTNEVTIRDGGVAVTKSDCANQICVDTGVIRSSGQMIICLPHRLAVEIRAAESDEEQYDAVVR